MKRHVEAEELSIAPDIPGDDIAVAPPDPDPAILTEQSFEVQPDPVVGEETSLMNISSEYLRLCAEPSDINEHLPILEEYSRKCITVTEMGVRTGVSTVALAMGHPKYMISYDVNPVSADLVKMLQREIRFVFEQQSSLEADIEPTDMLFIDTFHTYDQLYAELIRHQTKVKKYLVFHDTHTFGMSGEDRAPRGLIHAIVDALPAVLWKKIYESKQNNGLTIMERIADGLA
jgi:hypothetical protein